MIFIKHRSLLVDEKDVTKVLDVFNSCKSQNMLFWWVETWFQNLHIGNCGWAKAPTCWYISFEVPDRMWYKILQNLAVRGVTILPETIGY